MTNIFIIFLVLLSNISLNDNVNSPLNYQYQTTVNLNDELLNCKKLYDQIDKQYKEYLKSENKLNIAGSNTILNKLKNYIGQAEGIVYLYIVKYQNIDYDVRVFNNILSDLNEIRTNIIKKIIKNNIKQDGIILNNFKTILRLESDIIKIKYELNNYMFDIDYFNKSKLDFDLLEKKINLLNLSIKMPKALLNIMNKISRINKLFYTLTYYNYYNLNNITIIVSESVNEINIIFKELKDYLKTNNYSNLEFVNGLISIITVISQNFEALKKDNITNQ